MELGNAREQWRSEACAVHGLLGECVRPARKGESARAPKRSTSAVDVYAGISLKLWARKFDFERKPIGGNSPRSGACQRGLFSLTSFSFFSSSSASLLAVLSSAEADFYRVMNRFC